MLFDTGRKTCVTVERSHVRVAFLVTVNNDRLIGFSMQRCARDAIVGAFVVSIDSRPGEVRKFLGPHWPSFFIA